MHDTLLEHIDFCKSLCKKRSLKFRKEAWEREGNKLLYLSQLTETEIVRLCESGELKQYHAHECNALCIMHNRKPGACIRDCIGQSFRHKSMLVKELTCCKEFKDLVKAFRRVLWDVKYCHNIGVGISFYQRHCRVLARVIHDRALLLSKCRESWQEKPVSTEPKRHCLTTVDAMLKHHKRVLEFPEMEDRQIVSFLIKLGEQRMKELKKAHSHA